MELHQPHFHSGKFTFGKDKEKYMIMKLSTFPLVGRPVDFYLHTDRPGSAGYQGLYLPSLVHQSWLGFNRYTTVLYSNLLGLQVDNYKWLLHSGEVDLSEWLTFFFKRNFKNECSTRRKFHKN